MKIGHLLPVSDGMLSGVDFAPVLLAIDTRLPDERAADRWEAIERSSQLRSEILIEHALRVAEAAPLVRPFLELHAPSFYSEQHAEPWCLGCDGGTEQDAGFPCRTYDLAASLKEAAA